MLFTNTAHELHYNDFQHSVTGIGDGLRVLEYKDLDLYAWISDLLLLLYDFRQVVFSKSSLSIKW